MFTWLDSKGVRSDTGFEVQSTGRFTIEYRESLKKIEVYIERGMHAGQPCVIVMEEDAFARWDGDPPGKTIPKDKQQQMLKNFIEALEFQGLAVVIN